jgi:deoxycytidylate deaminase
VRPTREQVFLDMARLVATRSHCSKLQVGCVDCAAGPGERCPCVHAEANALVKVRFDGPLTVYSTHAPCETCAILAVNSGAAEFHFAESHKGDAGLPVLFRAGVRVFRAGTGPLAGMLGWSGEVFDTGIFGTPPRVHEDDGA